MRPHQTPNGQSQTIGGGTWLRLSKQYAGQSGDQGCLGERTARDGKVIEQSELRCPSSTEVMDDHKIAKVWSVDRPSDAFWQKWEKEVANIPEYLATNLHLICGLLLPIWDKLPQDSSKVHRLQANDGTVLLGRACKCKNWAKIFDNFGVEAPELSAEEIYRAVWVDRKVVQVGKWKLSRSYWKGDHYLEVLDVSGRERVEY